MPILGRLDVEDLPFAESIEAFRDAMASSAWDDVAFCHTPEHAVATLPNGLRRNHNWFGPGHSPSMTAGHFGESVVRGISSVILNDCRFVATSMTLIDRHMRLFTNGVQNLPDHNVLASFDPHYHLEPGEHLALNEDFEARAQFVECVAVPVCGLGMPNYGHFLYDGLPAAFMAVRAFEGLPIRIVGQELRGWQREVLRALGFEQDYLAVRHPAIFRKVLASTMLSMHVSYPTEAIRSMFDYLRFRFGATRNRPTRKIFLSRATDTTRRVLRNRAEVEHTLATLGVEFVIPEHMTFIEQIKLMSECQMVIGESGAAMANIGFCPLGTKVLEIQPERFPEGWTRGMCFVLGHQWHVFFASVDWPALGSDEANKPGSGFSYKIDPAELGEAVRHIAQAAGGTA